MSTDKRQNQLWKWLAIAAWMINIPSCIMAGMERGGYTPVSSEAVIPAYVSFVCACWFSIRWWLGVRHREKG
jgi:TRAP-type C4-dicarboxylate transport system permease large subunit